MSLKWRREIRRVRQNGWRRVDWRELKNIFSFSIIWRSYSSAAYVKCLTNWKSMFWCFFWQWGKRGSRVRGSQNIFSFALYFFFSQIPTHWMLDFLRYSRNQKQQLGVRAEIERNFHQQTPRKWWIFFSSFLSAHSYDKSVKEMEINHRFFFKHFSIFTKYPSISFWKSLNWRHVMRRSFQWILGHIHLFSLYTTSWWWWVS